MCLSFSVSLSVLPLARVSRQWPIFLLYCVKVLLVWLNHCEKPPVVLCRRAQEDGSAFCGAPSGLSFLLEEKGRKERQNHSSTRLVAERGLLVASPKQRLRSTLRFSLAECSIIACEQAGYTEPLMANEVLINLLDWCKRERENLQCQLDALKAGRFKTHSNDGSEWKDTTQDSIERVEENIWELSKLILKYEAARFDR
jgi:hypothetical protein